MLSALVRGSLRYRVVVLLLAAALTAAGIYAAATARYDVFPEFLPPMVVVQTEAPGFGPGEVESLVTRPIEASLNGTTGIKTLRSSSIQGLSVVTAVFEDRTDVQAARQFTGEKLAQLAGRLPQGVQPPVMAPMTSSSAIVLRVGLTAGATTPMELRTLADSTLRPRLQAVPGVAYVTIFGGEVQQYQALVRPERLVAYDVGLNDVLDAVRQAYGVVGAGFVENDNQRITLAAQAGAPSVEQLAQVVVAVRRNVPVRLVQVADVVIGAEPKLGDAGIRGAPAVELIVYKQFGANTLEVTERVEAALASLRDALPGDVQLHPRLFRQATFIERALRNINLALAEGGLLVVVVLFLFLASPRTALVSLTAIPLSLLAAVAALRLLGQTINTLTLGGLAIAIGEVVDDAIIDVENIHRRLRENASLPQPRPALAVILDASLEVRRSVVFATLLVALVFVPLFFLSGIQGRLFAPLGYAYVLSTLASLAVALTVTPALAAVLLPKHDPAGQETLLVRSLKWAYQRLLGPTLRRPWRVGAAALAVFAAAAAAVPFFGGELLPELNEGNYSIHMAGLPGTSMAESLRIGARVQSDLAALPAVDQVSQQVGRAELSEDIWGPHYSEIHVSLEALEGDEAEEATDRIREALAKYPGFSFGIKPFLTERIDEVLTGTTADVVVRVEGPDLDELDRLAARAAEVLRTIPGAADVSVQQQTGVPEYRLTARPEQCSRYGLRPRELLETLHAAFQGSVVNQVYDRTRTLDIAVRLTPEATRDADAVRSLLVNTPAGGRVPLDTLVSASPASGRALIAHEGTSRQALVQCNVRGRDVSRFLDDARREIQSRVARPAEYVFEFGGEGEAAKTARNELLALSAAVLLGIVVLLYAAFNSWRLVALVLANLPFALVGGVAAVALGGGVLSIGALVGFVTLLGISTRNSIMLVSHYQHLVEVERLPWGPELLLRGAAERLGPILMTALVTALGLLPIALGGASAGREIEQPMAVVILGGLVTSTTLTLLVLPTLIGRFGRFQVWIGQNRPQVVPPSM